MHLVLAMKIIVPMIVALLVCSCWTGAFPVAQPCGTAASIRWRQRGARTVTAAESNLKLIVCQGSSCNNEQEKMQEDGQRKHTDLRATALRAGLGRCKGDFNPKRALYECLEGTGGIELEEVSCMNMCKRGPNVRMVP